MTTQPVETVDFLLSKAARLDKALKSLPKADRKTLHTSSHKRARRLLRNLSFPAKGGELTAEHIENRIDVLTTVKSAAASFAKKIPPLTDALTVGPDALAVRACALEAREGLAEDLCSEEISKTGASLDYVDAFGLLADQRAQPWPDLKLFNEYYQTPPHLRLPKRSLLASESLPQLPSRNTIGGIEEATLQGNFPDLLPALIKSATGSLKVPEPKVNTDPTLPAKRSGSKQNIFHATAVYRDACKRFKVKVLNTLPILGEMVELVGSNLEETKHCYAFAEAVEASANVKGLKIEDCQMSDMGVAKVIEAAFAGEHLEVVSLSGLTLSYCSIVALHTALRQNRLGRCLKQLTLTACGVGGDLELMPCGVAAIYDKCRELLKTDVAEEEKLAKEGNVAGLLSEHLQDSLRKAKEAERPALQCAAAGMDATLEEEMEGDLEEEEELPPPPVLLPVFYQLMRSHVTTLNLSQTWLSPLSLTAFSNALPQTQIENLKLDECGLTDDALEELALRGILRSRGLLEVSLRRNQFSGNPGAITTLFHAVRIHARIAHLDLAENLMHPECVPELSQLLRHSVSLLCLHLLGCEDSQAEDTVAIQGACYRWVAENATGVENLEEVEIPLPAQGEEHSEVILCRAPHLDAKDWQVSTPQPEEPKGQDEDQPTIPHTPLPPVEKEKSKLITSGCWIQEAKEANARFQIPEGVPEVVAPEEEIGDWNQGAARIQALMDCFEEDIKIIYLKDVCHVDDEEAVKEALRSKYDLYYECYALFAGRSQWPFVRYVDMFSVFEEAHVVDRSGRRNKMEKRRLHMQDVHVMITQTLANHNGGDAVMNTEAEGERGEGRGRIPKAVADGNPVTRPQFFEVMLRAALSWGDDLSAGHAIKLFADEICSGVFLQPPLAPFPRGIALRPGEYSDAVLNSSKTLKEAWERFGYSNVAFQRLAQLVRLCDRSFTSKHVASIYALAKVPVVNDRVSTAGETRGLTYSEFVEAVGRLAMVWSRSSWMPACCPQEDGSMRGRRWPPQLQAGKPVKEHILAQRLLGFLQRLSDRMKPSIRGRVTSFR